MIKGKVIILKKIFSIILVAVMMLSIASVSVNAANVEDLTAGERALLIMQRADVNGDQVYSTDDVSIILKAAAGIIEIENEEFYDIDLDGYVSVRDAQLMLEVVSGVGDLVSDEDALEAFNSLLNGVKSKKPGFTRTTTAVVPSMKVTTSTGISGFDADNMEFSAYVNKMVTLMNTFPYNTVLDDAMKKELEEMKQAAIDLYKPQIETKTVAAGSNSHYTYFPVNNLGWSSNLTAADIKSIDCIVDDGCIVFTITMKDYNYAAGQYPTGTKGFSDRQKLPYGKIFNLPALDEQTDSAGRPITVVNSMKLQKGKIVLKADLLTGDIVSVDYSYSYISNITNNTYNEDGKLTNVMTSVTTANYSESYAMNH